MVGPRLTALIEEDELDLTDAIFVDKVEDLREPGLAVDAGDTDPVDTD